MVIVGRLPGILASIIDFPMPKLISCLRQLSAAQFTSGEQIAEILGVSRASVSTTLARAESFGVNIERRHGLGYRLSRPIEWLALAEVGAELAQDSVFRLELVEQIESTNRALLAQAMHGRVLAAEWQSGGRGRMGRKWMGTLGGSLLFSLVWSFPAGPAQLAGLPLAVGVALARAIKAAGVTEIGLKWPNDLLLPTGKAGGILIEMQGDALGPAAVVIGVGLNIGQPQNASGLDQPVAGLADYGLQLGRNALLGRILTELERTLLHFAQDGFFPLRHEWEMHHAWSDQLAQVRLPDASLVQGVIQGVADDGSLRLLVDGTSRVIHTGDVSLRRGQA